MVDFLTVENDGQAIVSTNYWQSDYAKRGFFYLTINAGAFRLLVPPSREGELADMLTASEVIVSRGPWPEHGKHDALELLFEDYSDSPYSLHITSDQVDRMPADADRHKTFVFAVWVQTGKVKEMPGRYRKVKYVPWLEPWIKTH
jgi:hypothetical protein